ncbi:MAG: GWxTD domain-containing protein, partial [bacterium]
MNTRRQRPGGTGPKNISKRAVASRLLVLLLLCASGLTAQPRQTAGGVEPFALSADYALFRGTNDQTHLEIYYSIPRSHLTLTGAPEATERAGVLLVVMRMWKESTLVLNEQWKLESRMEDPTQGTPGQSLVDQRRFVVEPGRYELTIYALDGNNPERRDSSLFAFTVAGWPLQGASMSDLQLCHSLQQSAGKDSSVFYKNSLIVVPAASRTYGGESPVLFYYVEVYNLPSSLAGELYTTRTSISDYRNEQVAGTEKVATRRAASASFAEVGHMNITALAGGIYTLNVQLSDTTGRELVRAAKQFVVYSPGQRRSAAGSSLDASRFAAMSGEELDREFDQASYLATESEKSVYESLGTEEAKRDFLRRFWKSRDATPETPDNEVYSTFQ